MNLLRVILLGISMNHARLFDIFIDHAGLLSISIEDCARLLGIFISSFTSSWYVYESMYKA